MISFNSVNDKVVSYWIISYLIQFIVMCIYILIFFFLKRASNFPISILDLEVTD
jgi:uncharacterized membrane protein AbrB (regulator of aidB expression)